MVRGDVALVTSLVAFIPRESSLMKVVFSFDSFIYLS